MPVESGLKVGYFFPEIFLGVNFFQSFAKYNLIAGHAEIHNPEKDVKIQA